MANQKRFEVVKFTIEQAERVQALVNGQISFIEEKGVDAFNAKEYVAMQEIKRLFTKD